jgi:hypothetical protein
VSFSGRAGDRVSFGFEDVTFGGGGANVMAASILDPKGEPLVGDVGSDLLYGSEDVIEARALPATGT